MFDSSKTFTDRIAGGIDLLIDVATLGEYGLEEVVEAPVAKTGSDRHAVRSHSDFNPQPRRYREARAATASDRSNVISLDRFLQPRRVARAEAAPSRVPRCELHRDPGGGDLAPVIAITSRQAARQDCAPARDYVPCTPAARRLSPAA